MNFTAFTCCYDEFHGLQHVWIPLRDILAEDCTGFIVFGCSEAMSASGPLKRFRVKTADPNLRSKSPDPKKLKKAEQLLKKSRGGTGSQRPILKDGTETPKHRVRKALSFELNKDETFEIDAENPAPRKSAKGVRASSEPARMSVTQADKIIESMAKSVLASFDSKTLLQIENGSLNGFLKSHSQVKLQ